MGAFFEQTTTPFCVTPLQNQPSGHSLSLAQLRVQTPVFPGVTPATHISEAHMLSDVQADPTGSAPLGPPHARLPSNIKLMRQANGRRRMAAKPAAIFQSAQRANSYC